MEATNTVEMQAETLSGDIRDQFLDIIRGMDEPWTKLSEHQQKKIIGNVEKLSRDAVRQMVDVIAHEGFRHVVIAVQDVSLGDALKIKATAAFTVEDVTKLASHGRGKPAVLVLADPTAFFGERAEAKADKDQPDLPIDEDGVFEQETELKLNELNPDGGAGKSRQRRRTTAGADAPPPPEMPADTTRASVDA